MLSPSGPSKDGGWPADETTKAMGFEIHQSSLVLISKPFKDTSDAFEEQLRQLQLQSSTVVCNFFGQRPTGTKGHRPEAQADANSNPVTYYFHGDRAIDAILPHMGESARGAAAVIGSAMAAGLASLILTQHQDGLLESADEPQRQLIRRYFDKLAAVADESLRTGGQKMPWFIGREVGDGNSQEEVRLRAMLC